MLVDYVDVGLTADEARDKAGGPSPEKYGQVEVWLPGADAPIVIDRDPSAGRLVVNPWRSDAATDIRKFEKSGLLDAKKTGAIRSNIRADRAGVAAPREYDHLRILLTKAETDRLGPEGLERLRTAVIATLRADPTSGPGQRMIHAWPVHTDTGNAHIDIMVHRFSTDLAAGYVSNSIDLGKLRNQQIEILNAVLKDQDLPLVQDATAAGKSIYGSELPAGQAREDADELVAEAGGRQAFTGVPGAVERPPLSIEEQRVTRHRDRERDALAKLVAEQERIKAEVEAASLRVADADHAVAAIEEAARVKAEAEAAKAEAAELVSALETRTNELEEVTARADQAEEALSTVREEVSELQAARDEVARQFAEEAEAHAITAKKLAEEAEAHSTTSQQLENSEKVVGRLQADLDQVRAESARITAEFTAQMGQVGKTIERLESELGAAKAAQKQAEDDLLFERESFVERARAWAEENVAGPLRAQIQMLRSELDGWRQILGSKIASLGEAVTGEQRQPVAPADWRSVRNSKEWTAAQRVAAEKDWKAAVAASPALAGAKSGEWVKQQKEKWRKEHPEEAARLDAEREARQQTRNAPKPE